MLLNGQCQPGHHKVITSFQTACAGLGAGLECDFYIAGMKLDLPSSCSICGVLAVHRWLGMAVFVCVIEGHLVSDSETQSLMGSAASVCFKRGRYIMRQRSGAAAAFYVL